MKRGTKVFLCLLSVVLATLIVAACIYCGYYPHYKRNQHAAVIADKPLERGDAHYELQSALREHLRPR